MVCAYLKITWLILALPAQRPQIFADEHHGVLSSLLSIVELCWPIPSIYPAYPWQAEMDALGSAIGFGPHHRRVYGLVHSFLAERDVQKTLENWVAEAYSEQAEDDVRRREIAD